MRTFTFSDADSHKFWNIDLTGNAFTVTYGRIGAKGTSQTKTFADDATAQREHDKLVKEKLAKGYRETTAAPAGTSASLTQALEEAILANPDDLTPYMALADHLTEQGDPRGEFMSVQIALENEKLSTAERKNLKERETELLKQFGEAWVGSWRMTIRNREPGERGVHDFGNLEPVRFERGILTDVLIHSLTPHRAQAFANSAELCMTRRLYLGDIYEENLDDDDEFDVPNEEGEPEATADVLLRWPYFGNLRVFQFGFTADEDYGDFCHFQCHQSCEELLTLIQRMPRLEELYLFAHQHYDERLTTLKMPHLRILQMYHGWDYALDSLARNSSMTNLTQLLCHPHAFDGQPEIRLSHLRAICRSKHLTKLTHLRLRLTDFGDEGCDEIVRSGILERLKILDLRHGSITDEGARLLASSPDLKNLDLLDVSRNALSAEGIAILKGVGIPVLTQFQHAEDSEEYLYEGDYE